MLAPNWNLNLDPTRGDLDDKLVPPAYVTCAIASMKRQKQGHLKRGNLRVVACVNATLKHNPAARKARSHKGVLRRSKGGILSLPPKKRDIALTKTTH